MRIFYDTIAAPNVRRRRKRCVFFRIFLLQSQFTKCVVVCCCARWHFPMKFIWMCTVFAVVVSFLISSKCFLCVSTSNMTIWLETKIKFVDSFLSEFHFFPSFGLLGLFRRSFGWTSQWQTTTTAAAIPSRFFLAFSSESWNRCPFRGARPIV